MNKTFQVVNKKGKTEYRIVRQVSGLDRMYKLGDKIPGLGLVIGIKI